uniref:Bromodomain and PHD finger-containing protein 3 n=1 Tax=Cajanus cajan TaxID=3821 RepID=A0A151SBK7_CAJCA|nr:Bromodomain and PHD finger-containing protein 3 [Cajanus cajan]
MVQIARRKKGRPSKADLARRSGEAPADASAAASSTPDLRRSIRRRNVRYNIIDYDDDYIDDEEDERRREKKKLKLMAKLNQGEEEEEEEREEDNEAARNRTRAESREKHAPQEEDDDENEQEEENEDAEEVHGEDEEDVVMHSAKAQKVESKGLHSVSVSGTPVILQSGIPLPDKRTLELILDKLQKKDTYGVFAEPVDPEELPDYHDVIDHPMDFSTVRKKLANGSYTTLEQFESDVFLICSNAMQYNAPETIYHKQARSIQELGRKKFEKLRLGFERSQMELKSEPKAGSSYLVKKQPKKPLARASQEPVGSDFSSGATLATVADLQPTSYPMQVGRCERPGNIGGILEANAFWIDANQEKSEDVLSGKGLVSKWGRKSFGLDESRRASYNISNQPFARSDSIFMTFDSEMKQLVAVGIHAEYSYARSLARFSASLGPIAWKIASHRIQQALPAGCKFGRGWVGDQQTSSNHSLVDTPPVTLSGPSGQKDDSGNAAAAAARAWMSVGAGGFKQGPDNSSSPQNQISVDSLYNSTREFHQHISRIRGEFPSGGMPLQPFQALASQPIHTGAVSEFSNRPMVFPQFTSSDQSRFQMQSPWRGFSPRSQSRQKQETLPPDLNIGFQSPGSPAKQSSGVLVDSQQPDLALQL